MQYFRKWKYLHDLKQLCAAGKNSSKNSRVDINSSQNSRVDINSSKNSRVDINFRENLLPPSDFFQSLHEV